MLDRHNAKLDKVKNPANGKIMESGELQNSELISLAKKEGRRLIKAIETQDIAMGNEAIKGMKAILDASVNAIEFDVLWHTGAIDYKCQKFCLTGNFTTGTKAECEKLITERGGIVSKAMTLNVDYLIVGGVKSDAWAHENYGRKIERALEIQRQRKSSNPYIVAESDWKKSL